MLMFNDNKLEELYDVQALDDSDFHPNSQSFLEEDVCCHNTHEQIMSFHNKKGHTV